MPYEHQKGAYEASRRDKGIKSPNFYRGCLAKTGRQKYTKMSKVAEYVYLFLPSRGLIIWALSFSIIGSVYYILFPGYPLQEDMPLIVVVICSASYVGIVLSRNMISF